MTELSKKTIRANELARKPGGVNTQELALDLGIPTGQAASRLQSAVLVFGIYRATDGRASRWFGTRAEAAAWGTLDPYRPAASYNGSATATPAKKRPAAVAVVLAPAPVDMSRAVLTRAEPFVDRRFKAELPPGYASQLDAGQCRGWAKAVTA